MSLHIRPLQSTDGGSQKERKTRGKSEKLEDRLSWHQEQCYCVNDIYENAFFEQILRKYDCKSVSLSGSEGDRLLRCLVKRGAEYHEVHKVVQLVDHLSKVCLCLFVDQIVLNAFVL